VNFRLPQNVQSFVGSSAAFCREEGICLFHSFRLFLSCISFFVPHASLIYYLYVPSSFLSLCHCINHSFKPVLSGGSLVEHEVIWEGGRSS